MNNTNCPNCDKPECMAPVWQRDHDAYMRKHPDDWHLYWHIKELKRTLASALVVCQSNTVNWRARALPAEARIAEVEAVAKRLADFFDRQPSDYRLGLRHGAQRAVEGLASQIGEPKP